MIIVINIDTYTGSQLCRVHRASRVIYVSTVLYLNCEIKSNEHGRACSAKPPPFHKHQIHYNTTFPIARSFTYDWPHVVFSVYSRTPPQIKGVTVRLSTSLHTGPSGIEHCAPKTAVHRSSHSVSTIETHTILATSHNQLSCHASETTPYNDATREYPARPTGW